MLKKSNKLNTAIQNPVIQQLEKQFKKLKTKAAKIAGDYYHGFEYRNCNIGACKKNTSGEITHLTGVKGECCEVYQACYKKKDTCPVGLKDLGKECCEKLCTKSKCENKRKSMANIFSFSKPGFNTKGEYCCLEFPAEVIAYEKKIIADFRSKNISRQLNNLIRSPDLSYLKQKIFRQIISLKSAFQSLQPLSNFEAIYKVCPLEKETGHAKIPELYYFFIQLSEAFIAFCQNETKQQLDIPAFPHFIYLGCSRDSTNPLCEKKRAYLASSNGEYLSELYQSIDVFSGYFLGTLYRLEFQLMQYHVKRDKKESWADFGKRYLLNKTDFSPQCQEFGSTLSGNYFIKLSTQCIKATLRLCTINSITDCNSYIDAAQHSKTQYIGRNLNKWVAEFYNFNPLVLIL